MLIEFAWVAFALWHEIFSFPCGFAALTLPAASPIEKNLILSEAPSMCYAILVVAIGISQIFMIVRRDVVNDWIQKIK